MENISVNDYQNCHRRLRKKYGKASKCEFIETCNKKSKRYQWALKKGRVYSENPDDYIQLCASCHNYYDRKMSREIKPETKLKIGLGNKGKIRPKNMIKKQHKHGTVSGYQYHKCRCELCKEAKHNNYKIKTQKANQHTAEKLNL